MSKGSLGKISLLVGAGIVLGFLATFFVTNITGATTGQITAEQAGDIVRNAMGAQGAEVTIESVDDQSPSMYKVIVNGGGDSLQKMYVSKDGQYLFNNPTNATQFIQRAQARTDFIACLQNRQIQILGRSDSRATQAQIQLLGGTNGLQGIYQELNNQTIRTLAQQGVQQIPVTIYNQSVYEGIQTIPALQNLTGCQYQTN